MPEATYTTRVKVTPRVFIYGESKTPGVDNPDEIREFPPRYLEAPDAEAFLGTFNQEE